MTWLLSVLTNVLRALVGAWLARPDPVAAPSREAGAAETDLAVARASLEAQWRVTQAAQDAPKTEAQVDDLLSDGEA